MRNKVVYSVLDKVGLGAVKGLKLASAFIERHPILAEKTGGGGYRAAYDEYNKLCEYVLVCGERMLVCGWVTDSGNITIEVKKDKR